MLTQRTHALNLAGDKMTINACILCGEIGRGILIPCKMCGYKPTTSWEMAFAIYNSDHNLTRDSVLKAGSGFSERYLASKPVFFRFSPEDEKKLLRFLAEPDGRDVLELRRGAKNGFLSRQLNFHFVGPDGYESKIVTRGKDLPKKEFDSIARLGSMDVFLIRDNFDGNGQGRIIDKDMWYAIKDDFDLLGRLSKNKDKMMSAVIAMARHHTLNYLESRGLDLRHGTKG